MLLHAATDRLRAAAPRLHRIGMSVGLQLKHVEVPGTVVDEETLINEIGAGAIVNLGPHSVGQAYLPAAKFREWQRQSALCLAAGIIDDDDMAGAVLTGPGRGDEAIRGPVVGPGWLRFYLRPSAVAKRLLSIQPTVWRKRQRSPGLSTRPDRGRGGAALGPGLPQTGLGGRTAVQGTGRLGSPPPDAAAKEIRRRRAARRDSRESGRACPGNRGRRAGDRRPAWHDRLASGRKAACRNNSRSPAGARSIRGP